MIAKGTATCESCGAIAQIWYQPECRSVLCPNCMMEIKSESIVVELIPGKSGPEEGKSAVLELITKSFQRMAACL